MNFCVLTTSLVSSIVSSHGGHLYFQITEKYVNLIRGTVLLRKLLSYHYCKEVKLTELVEEQQSHVRETMGHSSCISSKLVLFYFREQAAELNVHMVINVHSVK